MLLELSMRLATQPALIALTRSRSATRVTYDISPLPKQQTLSVGVARADLPSMLYMQADPDWVPGGVLRAGSGGREPAERLRHPLQKCALAQLGMGLPGRRWPGVGRRLHSHVRYAA